MSLPRAATAALALLAASACPSLIVGWAAGRVDLSVPAPTATSGVGGEPRDGVGRVPQPVRPPKGGPAQPARTAAPATTVPATSSTTAAGGSSRTEPPATTEPAQPPATSTKPIVPTVTVTVPPLITQPPVTEKAPEPAASPS